MLQQLQGKLAELLYHDVGERISVSIGLCIVTSESFLTDQAVVERANFAMRHAKRQQGKIDSVSNMIRSPAGIKVNIGQTISALRSGALLPSNVPPIRLFIQKGLIYTLDNRRLLIANLAGTKVLTRLATAEEIARELAAKKMTTVNFGKTVGIRGPVIFP